MEICPKCNNYSAVYDEYYKRKICLIVDCSWSGKTKYEDNGKKELEIIEKSSKPLVLKCQIDDGNKNINTESKPIILDDCEDGICTLIFPDKLINR